MNNTIKIFLYFTVAIWPFFGSICQDKELKIEVLESIRKDLKHFYVDSLKAIDMIESLQYVDSIKQYSRYRTLDEFLYAVTVQLRAVSGDPHIIFFSKSLNKAPKYSKRQINRILKQAKEKSEKDCFEYEEVSILKDGAGYISIQDFSSCMNTGKPKRGITLDEVFSFLGSSTYLIIDLRNCNGGSTKMSAKFCSFLNQSNANYFITEEEVTRIEIKGVVKEISTKKDYYLEKKGQNNFNRKIVVLTSERTFSAAELISYKLKKINPNTLIIGKRTLGGGNAYSSTIKGENYEALIPTIRTFDRDNQDYNFEGIGILPDIDIDSGNYLSPNLGGLTINTLDKTTTRKKYLIKRKSSENNFIEFNTNIDELCGNYFKLVIEKIDNKLFMIYDRLIRLEIKDFTKDQAHIPGFGNISFFRDENRKVVRVKILKEGGYNEEFYKVSN